MSHQILVIEDSATIQKAIAIALSRENVQLTASPSAQDGAGKAQQAPPSLILLDASLPDGDAYAMAQELRQTPSLSQTPIVMMVGRQNPFDEMRGAQAGVRQHIVKPFETAAFATAIREALGAPAPAQTAPTQTAPAAATQAPTPTAAPGIASTTAPPAMPSPGVFASPPSTPGAPAQTAASALAGGFGDLLQGGSAPQTQPPSKPDPLANLLGKTPSPPSHPTTESQAPLPTATQATATQAPAAPPLGGLGQAPTAPPSPPSNFGNSAAPPPPPPTAAAPAQTPPAQTLAGDGASWPAVLANEPTPVQSSLPAFSAEGSRSAEGSSPAEGSAGPDVWSNATTPAQQPSSVAATAATPSVSTADFLRQTRPLPNQIETVAPSAAATPPAVSLPNPSTESLVEQTTHSAASVLSADVQNKLAQLNLEPEQVLAMLRDVLESVAWQVVPPLAEAAIQKHLREGKPG